MATRHEAGPATETDSGRACGEERGHRRTHLPLAFVLCERDLRISCGTRSSCEAVNPLPAYQAKAGVPTEGPSSRPVARSIGDPPEC
jgi:hypothetical protein